MKFDPYYVSNKKPWFGKVSIDTDWSREMKFLDSHPSDCIDTNEEKVRIFLNSCLKRASLSPWAKEIGADMRKFFHKNPITLIKFYSFGYDGQSYPWHADKMDVFLVQGVGRAKIRVENTYTENAAIDFLPGDCVFIPRGTHHEITPQESRVTYSFGVEHEPDPATYIAI